MIKSFSLKKIIFPLGILAIILLFGFVIWLLTRHGTIGLIRVTSIFLFLFIIVIALGITFTGLFVWYWRLYLKGREKKSLLNFLLIVSIIFIVVSVISFIDAGGLPPSKDVNPTVQLPVPNTETRNFCFAVGSDAHFGAGTNSPEKTIAMLDWISNPENKYNAFFYLGDLVEHGYDDNQWEEAINTFSSAAGNVPVRFIPGNHDTLFGGLSRYLSYCAPKMDNKQNTSRLWSRIDTGNIHFLLLDVEWSAETVTEEQLKWLEEQLQDIPAEDWKIVMSHGFYYASGITLLGWNWYDNDETISRLAPLFEKYGVDMVFSGHNHYMELLQHSGVTYAIAGAFGGRPDPDPTYISPDSVWRTAGQSGFIDVDIHGNDVTLNFRDYNSVILKSVTVTKRDTL